MKLEAREVQVALNFKFFPNYILGNTKEYISPVNSIIIFSA